MGERIKPSGVLVPINHRTRWKKMGTAGSKPAGDMDEKESDMLKGTRVLMGDEARLYNKVIDTLRGCLHRG